MKHTENEIRVIALKIWKDIDGQFYRDNFHKNDELNFPIKKTIDTWAISINSLFDNRDFLIISDDTGEPIYYQNFNYITTEIIKKDDGIYDYKE